jgi:hypothetical protein
LSYEFNNLGITILNSLNPINIKKKEIYCLDPARARKSRSILLRSKSIPPFHPYSTPPVLFLSSPSPDWGSPIFNLIAPLCSYRVTTFPATSLAESLFFFLAALSQLAWRLRQLAALRHLNKPTCAEPPLVPRSRAPWCSLVLKGSGDYSWREGQELLEVSFSVTLMRIITQQPLPLQHFLPS